jgi:hypothetical protein
MIFPTFGGAVLPHRPNTSTPCDPACGQFTEFRGILYGRLGPFSLTPLHRGEKVKECANNPFQRFPQIVAFQL